MIKFGYRKEDQHEPHENILML